MNNKQLLEKVFMHKDLSAKEISFLLNNCINGELNQSQIAALLIGLRMKGETVEEIYGLIQCMRDHLVKFPVIYDAIDTCGTGGDGAGTFNVSTSVALVVAGAGIRVVKHGNKAASSRCGSADVLSQIGVHIMHDPQQAERILNTIGIVFLYAPLYHPMMKHIAPIRKALGTRTVFNYLGPFLNPAGVTKQLIGAPNVMLAEKLAQVASKLAYEHVIIVTSVRGIDEITINGESKLFEIKGTKIAINTINPRDFGFKKSSLKEIKGGSVRENATIIQNILKGEKGAKRDMVVLNSAYALYVSGKVKDVFDGIEKAIESIDSGAAANVLSNLIKETQKYA